MVFDALVRDVRYGLRTLLRASGAAARGASKAYWSVGKSGLD